MPARSARTSFRTRSGTCFELRHLITAHPLGGCPMGEDYLHGAVDEFGRVFAQDGSVHDGLFVADGALMPSAPGVNPFLTISALSERIAERKIQEMQGNPYPAPPRDGELRRTRSARDDAGPANRSSSASSAARTTLGIDEMLNQGGPPAIDVAGAHHPQRPVLERLLPARPHSEHDVVGDLHRLQEAVQQRGETVRRTHQRHRRPHQRPQLARRDHPRPNRRARSKRASTSCCATSIRRGRASTTSSR